MEIPGFRFYLISMGEETGRIENRRSSPYTLRAMDNIKTRGKTLESFSGKSGRDVPKCNFLQPATSFRREFRGRGCTRPLGSARIPDSSRIAVS